MSGIFNINPKFASGLKKAKAGAPLAMNKIPSSRVNEIFLLLSRWVSEDPRRQRKKTTLEVARQIAALDGWQPIETAPRDGTRIILWNGGKPCQGLWYVNDLGKGGWFFESKDTPSARAISPTRWHPMPDSPKVKHE